jgi:hypothetical protein
MLTGAFMHYRALQTAAELELADHLANGPLDVNDLASRSKAHAPSLFRMIADARKRWRFQAGLAARVR